MKKIENKYFKWYWNICENARGRELPKETYAEKHHVYPKSLYPDQTDLVSLTAKEHYIVHLLLWRGFRYEYGVSDERTRKMACAFTMMNRIGKDNKGRKKIDNSNEYSFLRIAYREINKTRKYSSELRQKMGKLKREYLKNPENHHMYKKHHSEETKKKIGKAHKGKKLSCETKKKISDKLKGKKVSNETKKKMSYASKYRKYLKGKDHPCFGKKHKKETIEKIKEKRKKQIFTEETKLKLSLSHRKRIQQFDKYNNFMTEYPSIKEAGKINSLFTQNISAVCNGRQKTCGGYIWKFK